VAQGTDYPRKVLRHRVKFDMRRHKHDIETQCIGSGLEDKVMKFAKC